MRSYPSRPATGPLWTPTEPPDAGSPSSEPMLIAAVETLCELLAAPAAAATVQTINAELMRRHCLYRLRRPGGPQRR